MLPRGTLTLDDGRELRIEIVRSSGDGRALLIRAAEDAGGSIVGAFAEPAASRRTEAIERSAALTRASREELPDEPVTPAAARAVAAAIGAAEIPQPPGADSAGAIDWEQRCGGDAITLGELHELLELGAARDWLRYASRHRLTAEQRLILSDVPRWPRLRDDPLGDEVAAAVTALLADGDAEPARALAERLARPAACR
jgi:xanthine dehydrogenase iron-sulfur cluster and FAD-binding subunit A